MIKIGAIWRKEKEGKVFYSGKVDMPCSIILDSETSILVFSNKAKEAGNEQAPDFDVLISKSRQRNASDEPTEL